MRKEAAPTTETTTKGKSTVVSVPLCYAFESLVSKAKALNYQLPWRDQIESLPDNARLNIGSTNPLTAAASHNQRKQSAEYKVAVYWLPEAKTGFWMYLSRREIEILLMLEHGEWVPTAMLKGVAETRRPLSTIRAFGLIIATCCHPSTGNCYKLFGRVDLNPLPPVQAGAVEVIDLLPGRVAATKIAHQRALSSFAKQLALIDKRATLLNSETRPQQLPLPDTNA